MRKPWRSLNQNQVLKRHSDYTGLQKNIYWKLFMFFFKKKKTELGLFLHHECKNEIHFSQSHQAFIPIRFREI